VLGRAGPYDVVISDMAPATTGTRFADQARSFELLMRAVDVAERMLKPGGAFVGKIFMSDDLPKAKERVRKLFNEVRLLRPEATRTQSYELFPRRARPQGLSTCAPVTRGVRRRCRAVRRALRGRRGATKCLLSLRSSWRAR
jgi:anion-transporting  ArsA/GET3 family ATPase